MREHTVPNLEATPADVVWGIARESFRRGVQGGSIIIIIAIRQEFISAGGPASRLFP